jgi:hypothetical protein
MLTGIADSQKVRAQKAVMSSQSTGVSSSIPHRLEDRHEIKMLKEALRQRDEAMRQRVDLYASAFAQQQVILQVS